MDFARRTPKILLIADKYNGIVSASLRARHRAHRESHIPVRNLSDKMYIGGGPGDPHARPKRDASVIYHGARGTRNTRGRNIRNGPRECPIISVIHLQIAPRPFAKRNIARARACARANYVPLKVARRASQRFDFILHC